MFACDTLYPLLNCWKLLDELLLVEEEGSPAVEVAALTMEA